MYILFFFKEFFSILYYQLTMLPHMMPAIDKKKKYFCGTKQVKIQIISIKYKTMYLHKF